MDILQTSTPGITYVRRTANRHHIVEVIHRQKPPNFYMHVQVPPLKPTIYQPIYIFATRNEAYLGLPFD